MLSRMYKASRYGCGVAEAVRAVALDDKLKSKESGAYSVKKWDLFRACMSRELLLMKRNSFIYVFKCGQLVIMASLTMTVFLRSEMRVDAVHANAYMGALFYSVIMLVADGLPELGMTMLRLDVFYKQRESRMYPAWAYAVPATILKIPLSFLTSLLWTCLTYYTIGYSPHPTRFLGQMMVLFALHLASISMFRCVAPLFNTMVVSLTAASLLSLFVFVVSGFMIPRCEPYVLYI